MERVEKSDRATTPEPQNTASAISAQTKRDSARLAALRRTGLANSIPDPEFDRIARLAARLLRVPIALVTLMDEERQLHKGHFGLPEPFGSRRETPLSHSLCKHVVSSDAPLVIPDARVHPQTRENPTLQEFKIIAYLGIPLHTPDGTAVGTLCVTDQAPRQWTEEDIDLLRDLGAFVVTEIALRWQLEESRRLSDRLERFLNFAPAALYLYDIVEKRNIFTSAASAAMLGVTPEEIQSDPMRFMAERMHPDDAKRYLAHVECLRHLADKETASIEYRLRQPDGSWGWFLSHDAAYGREEHGAVKQVLGIAIDITERKRAEEALKESEERLDLALSGAELGTWYWNMETGEVLYNRRWAEMLGYDPEEVEPHFSTWEKLVHPDDKIRVLAAIYAHIDGSTPLFSAEHRLRTKDGQWKWVLTRGKTFRNADGQIVRTAGVHLDLSAMKAAEAAAQTADQKLARILESMAEACSAIGPDWRYTFVNPQWEALFGRRKEEVIGRRLWELAPRLRGTIFEENYRKAMSERVTVRFEFFSPIAHRWLDMRAFPAADGGLNTFIADIHERKLAEETVREESKRKDEFMAMLGHELRNPLAAIRHALNTWTADESPKVFEWSRGVIERQTTHLVRLVDDLLDVSRITRGKVTLRKERLDIAATLDHACESVLSLIEERRHQFSKHYDQGVLWAEADPVRLEQIIDNLLTNAAKYTEPGGRISLEARREETPEGRDELVIRVSDTGMGIPSEKLPQMFDLFVQGERSLARIEGGLGLGLSIVKTLTEMHGGRVMAESKGPGKGSVFTVRIPALPIPRTAAPRNVHATPGKPSPHRVLVVDDLADIAQGLARLLRRQGHTVEVAEDGFVACKKAHDFAPEVVLLDIGLPGMSGYEVAQHLRHDRCCSDALIIAITGYGQDEDRRRALQAGFDEHLVKPVDVDRLKSLVGSAPHRENGT